MVVLLYSRSSVLKFYLDSLIRVIEEVGSAGNISGLHSKSLCSISWPGHRLSLSRSVLVNVRIVF
jgi:hypothetical protein